ncbi:hypothetical protein CDAR_401741 [Caerostris darwini]|uniref:Uncharacterized protein n=1 Tax=Caerostris darwini TaxID=1538125 RepID=A0AAV4T3L0_9ARAC|nr:hypothetical protein CDAR_401741 [Caerostris darwini]
MHLNVPGRKRSHSVPAANSAVTGITEYFKRRNSSGGGPSSTNAAKGMALVGALMEPSYPVTSRRFSRFPSRWSEANSVLFSRLMRDFPTDCSVPSILSRLMCVLFSTFGAFFLPSRHNLKPNFEF